MTQMAIELIKARRVANELLTAVDKDFIDFTINFHNFVYILKGIFDILSMEEKNRVGDDYFLQIIKMLREVKMHNGDDFLKLKLVSIPGISMRGGPLVINNEGILILGGKLMPKGEISFGKEIDTINGLQSELGVQTIKSYGFRAISRESKYERNYHKFNDRFVNTSPSQFISECIIYYESNLGKSA